MPLRKRRPNPPHHVVWLGSARHSKASHWTRLPDLALLRGCLSRCVIGLERSSLSPLTPVMLAGCFLLSSLVLTDRRSLPKPHGKASWTASQDERLLTAKPAHLDTQGKKKQSAMRRKSRIQLCFAVLWVLGIAYYFYSGTTLSRKVGLPLLACFFWMRLTSQPVSQNPTDVRTFSCLWQIWWIIFCICLQRLEACVWAFL